MEVDSKYFSTLFQIWIRKLLYTLKVYYPQVSSYNLGFKKLDSFTTNSSYEFKSEQGTISNLFKLIESNKKEHGILDWGVSQTTLEEVFLKIISEADAQSD